VRIPRYWARATDTTEGPARRRFRLETWGWSDRSVSEALEVARRRLADVAARIASGDLTRKYPYGERPLREEIVRTLAPDEAIVTRNRYGALVLNTARVPFIDVDAPEPQPEWFRKLRGLFARRPLVTRELLEALGSDPRFVKLCAVQESFRARLTPKPWRCDVSLPPGQHPREDTALRARVEEWLRGYEAASEHFATCRFIEHAGPDHRARGGALCSRRARPRHESAHAAAAGVTSDHLG
jgi:hypothetical protein